MTVEDVLVYLYHDGPSVYYGISKPIHLLIGIKFRHDCFFFLSNF